MKQPILPRLIQRTPFFYGWVIVAGAFLGAFASGGIQGFTFSIFIKPMSESLGWTRSALTGGITLNALMASVLAPVFGYLIDRHGPRYIMAASAIIGGTAAILLSQVQELWQFYLIFGVAGVFGGAAVGEVVTQSTVVKWFVRRRGRAIAFSSMGGAAAGAVLTPLISIIVFTIGWRTGWLAMAVMFFVLLLPVSFLMVRRPEDVGLLPDGADPSDDIQPDDHARGTHEPEYSYQLREALRTRALWLLTITLTIVGLCISSVVLHEFSFVTDQGFTPAVATAVLSTHAAMAVTGRLLWGFIVEHFQVRYCMASVFIVCALALVILMTANSTPMLFVFAIIYGLSIGGYSVTTAVAFASYFGRDYVGTIRGAVSPLIIGSVAIGPLLVSLGYDFTGSYLIPFNSMIALFLIGGVLVLLAKPPVRSKAAVWG